MGVDVWNVHENKPSPFHHRCERHRCCRRIVRGRQGAGRDRGYPQFASRGNWDDTFDARAAEGGKVASNLPIFSLHTVGYVEQAIAQYSNIVAQGGWQPVPDTKKLKLGVVDPDVVPLRKRLMVSGDLPQSAGISEAFDTYVDAAVKRFQARHGLPADGVLGKYSYAAMNISAPVRLGQLETNLVRLRSMSGELGQRYVMVNVPAAQIEAVENDRVVLRHTAIVGKVDRQTPILNSKINEIVVNPYWNAPESIVRKDIIPLMRKDPDLPLQEQHPHPWTGRRDRPDHDRLEHRGRGEIPAAPGSGRRQRYVVGENQLPEPGRCLHARHPATEPVLEVDAL